MQKEIIVFLGSVQNGGMSGDDRMEIITAGQYYYKNGKHYIIYEEIQEDGGTAAKNVIKICDGKAEIIKSGEASVHMIFEEHKKNYSYYDMPYGKMLVGLETKRLDFKEEENHISLQLEYRLEIDYNHMADCVVNIRAESKEHCRVNLI